MSDAVLEVRLYKETESTWDKGLELVSIIPYENIEARNKSLIEEALDFEYITFTKAEYFKWFNEFYDIDESLELDKQQQPDFVLKQHETATKILDESDYIVQVWSFGEIRLYNPEQAPSILEAALEHDNSDWQEYCRTENIPAVYFIKADDLREFVETKGHKS